MMIVIAAFVLGTAVGYTCPGVIDSLIETVKTALTKLKDMIMRHIN